MSLMKTIFATKSVEAYQAEAASTQMKRTLGALDVILIGVGDIIGTGIFVITGNAAAEFAGPAIVLSFLIAGVACAFAGLCYGEMASLIPASGSAYSYVYAALGESVAFICGSNLLLEYLLGSALAAQGFTSYLQKFLKTAFHVKLSETWTMTPWDHSEATGFVTTNGYINLPAFLVVTVISIILTFGARASANFNHFAAGTKLIVILTFLFATFSYIDASRWSPFIPTAADDPTGKHEYGIGGVFHASTLVFIAYIGFDAVSTTAQETKNPARDMPIGILGSLVICTILYILVSLNLTGITDFRGLTSGSPLADSVSALGMNWLVVAISVGALAGLVSVILVSLMSLPRILMTIAVDGLLPPSIGELHPTYKTPYKAILLNWAICGSIAAFVPIGIISHMVSSGTLFAFALVCLSTGVLRVQRPDLERPFKVPLGPYIVPGLGTLVCLALIAVGGAMGVLRLAIWILAAFAFYFVYGRTHSRVNNPEREIVIPGWEHLSGKGHAMEELKMARLPENVLYRKSLADTIVALNGIECDASAEVAAVGALASHLNGLRTAVDELDQAINKVNAAGDDPVAQAKLADTALLPAMDAVRVHADALEQVVADKFWPLPKYTELLFQ
ncbi:hypothetical protein H9P43_001766 [Blastocladiella emersonii ATCC 22665]|nr:hypothetical protein H9P43_001766 [Blastocladiella emersonii ATCC 22665]